MADESDDEYDQELLDAIDPEAAEELAKVLVRSILEDENITTPGEGTTALLRSLFPSAEAAENDPMATTVALAKAIVTMGCVGQIAASLIRGAQQQGIAMHVVGLEPDFDIQP